MIDHDLFIKWADHKIGQPIIKGDQIRFNSPFCEDNKHHLYCNIKKFWKGVYNCFKSNNKGTVVALVMKVDNCNYDSALETLGIKKNKFFEKFEIEFEGANIELLPQEEFSILQIPDSIVPINEAPSWLKNKAKEYLQSRLISQDIFYLGIDGRMKNRIIIPYKNRTGDWIYYNGRALFENKLRYLGPPKDEHDIGKSDVIFFPKWFEHNQKIYVCEGEFDCLSICDKEIVACAIGGKFVSVKQASILSNKKICLSFDNDEAGKTAIETSAKLLKSFGCQVTFVHPPQEIKDWNEFLIKHGKNMLFQYIKLAEKELEV
jgi:DNA primase